LIGLFAFVIGVIGAGRPSLWLDEVATMSATGRSLPQLWALLHHVDGVHGAYYFLMQGWFTVFPADQFWARFVSSVLVGAAASGVVVIGRQLASRQVAVAAGVVFAVLPRVTWAAVEARSYAMSMFDAVWITVLFLMALRRRSVWLWAAYAAGLALSTVFNVFVIFVVAAHAVLVLGNRPARRTIAAWICAVVAATIAALPFMYAIKAQQAQVGWIWAIGPGTLGQLIGDQYFPAVYSSSERATNLVPNHKVTSAEIAAGVHAQALVAPFIIAVLVLTVVAWRMRRRPGAPLGERPRLLGWMAAAWIIVPTAVIVAYSMVREPMYQPHYLSFTAPALALLLGMAVVTVGREPRRIAVVLTVLAAAAVPNYVAQRGPYAKYGMDYIQVADIVSAHAQPGDCLNIDLSANSTVVGPLKAAKPAAYARLRDFGQDKSALELEALFETRLPITAWADKLPSCPVVWTVTERDRSLPAHRQAGTLTPGPRLASTAAYQVPAARGFRVVEQWQLNVAQVAKLVPAK
jgi:mannosyltransferase